VTFIQGSFPGDGVHGNLEVIVQVSPPLPIGPDHLDFYFLDSDTELLWGPFTMFADGRKIEVPIGF